MKVSIIDGCIACGLCEAICPEVFVMNDLAEVIPDSNPDAHAAAVKDAAAQCPVEVIKIQE